MFSLTQSFLLVSLATRSSADAPEDSCANVCAEDQFEPVCGADGRKYRSPCLLCNMGVERAENQSDCQIHRCRCLHPEWVRTENSTCPSSSENGTPWPDRCTMNAQQIIMNSDPQSVSEVPCRLSFAQYERNREAARFNPLASSSNRSC